jgi:signal transduction histidine kinase
LFENETGSVVGTVGICRDISEKNMLRQKLVQSEKMAGLGTLASGIAHEINNPLAGVLGMAEAIRDENDLEKIKSFSKDIIDYTLEASAIVKELSDYSRMAVNEAISTTDLSSLIEKSFKILKHSNDFSKISFETDLQDDCWISANSGEMQQIFTNLITNAVDAMENKGGELVLKCSRDKRIVKAVVSDTGMGIKKEHLNRIYDPFFSTKLPGKGTGLGLFVIYKIVSKYKGNVEVISEEGKGTSVLLTFPLLPSFLKTQEE